MVEHSNSRADSASRAESSRAESFRGGALHAEPSHVGSPGAELSRAESSPSGARYPDPSHVGSLDAEPSRSESSRADSSGEVAVDGGLLLGRAPGVSCVRAAAVLGQVVTMPVGGAQVALLDTIDVSRLNDADRLVFLTAWQQALNWLQARHVCAVAAAGGPPRPLDADMDLEEQRRSHTGSLEEDSRLAEIAASLGISHTGAWRLVQTARVAVTTLGPVLAQMGAGRWSMSHLRRAQDAVEHHPEQLAAEATAAAVARGQKATPGVLKRRIQQELVNRDAEAMCTRIKAARRSRGVSLWAQDDFTAELATTGDWSRLQGTFTQLTGRAHQLLDFLRAHRRCHPGTTYCCPAAIQRALATSTDPTTNPVTPHTTGTSSAAGHLTGMSSATAHLSGMPPAAGHLSGMSPAAGPLTGTSQATQGLPDTDSTGADPAGGAVGVVPCADCGSTSTDLPTLDQLRADALVEAGHLLAAHMSNADSDADGEPAVVRRGARWRHAVVVTDLPTVLGVAHNPGWVPGYGYVPAQITRELLADCASWQRFLLDTDGQVIGVGNRRYRPSRALREVITARDLTCTFPGCTRSAATADLDHRINYNGANTTASNLHALCRTHHRLKTYTTWAVHRDSRAIDHWYSPAGLRYTNQPPEPPWTPPQPHPRN